MAEATAQGAAGATPTGGQGQGVSGDGQKKPAGATIDRPQGSSPAAPPKPKTGAVPIPETAEQKAAREKRQKDKTKRENLLGFNLRGAGEDDFPDLIGEAQRREGISPSLERDPKTGQFLPRSGEAGEKGKEGVGAPPRPAGAEGGVGGQQQQQAAPPKPGEPQQAGQDGASVKVKFLGQEKTLAEIEQTHKSLQGMYNSLSEEKRGLERERSESWDVAWQWKRAHDQVAERLAAYERGENPASQSGSGGKAGANGAAPAQGTSSPSVDEIAGSIDADAFEAIASKFGVSHAVRYLTQELLKTITEKVLPGERERLMKEVSEIAQQPQQEAAALRQVDQMIRQVGALKDSRGNLAFPEVNDPAKLEQIGRIWKAYGNDPATIFSNGGLIAAVGLYRTHNGLAAAPEPAADPTASTTTGAAAVDPAVAAAVNASVPANGGPQTRPEPAHLRGLSESAKRFMQGLDSVSMRTKTKGGVDLGFARNPRSRAN